MVVNDDVVHHSGLVIAILYSDNIIVNTVIKDAFWDFNFILGMKNIISEV